jgi:hypothetical protein
LEKISAPLKKTLRDNDMMKCGKPATTSKQQKGIQVTDVVLIAAKTTREGNR